MSDYALPPTDPLGTDLRLSVNGDLLLTVSGSLDVATTADNAAQAVRTNITTIPVAYLWGDDVGTTLAAFVDEPITSATEQSIKNVILERVANDPRILDVQNVSVDASQKDTLIITIEAVVNGIGTVQIPVTLGGV
jgi:phage baseplate assembly protein W